MVSALSVKKMDGGVWFSGKWAFARQTHLKLVAEQLKLSTNVQYKDEMLDVLSQIIQELNPVPDDTPNKSVTHTSAF